MLLYTYYISDFMLCLNALFFCFVFLLLQSWQFSPSFSAEEIKAKEKICLKSLKLVSSRKASKPDSFLILKICLVCTFYLLPTLQAMDANFLNFTLKSNNQAYWEGRRLLQVACVPQQPMSAQLNYTLAVPLHTTCIPTAFLRHGFLSP